MLRPLRVCLAPNSQFNFILPSPKPMSKHSNEIAPSNLGRTARPVNGAKQMYWQSAKTPLRTSLMGRGKAGIKNEQRRQGKHDIPRLAVQHVQQQGQTTGGCYYFYRQNEFPPAASLSYAKLAINFVPVSRGLRKRHDLIYSAVTKPAAKHSNEIA